MAEVSLSPSGYPGKRLQALHRELLWWHQERCGKGEGTLAVRSENLTEKRHCEGAKRYVEGRCRSAFAFFCRSWKYSVSVISDT